MNRILLCALVLALCLSNGDFCERQVKNQILKRLKTSNLAVTLKSDRLHLKIQKDNEPSSLELFLITKFSDISSPKTHIEIEDNCEPNTLCLHSGGLVHVKILTDPSGDIVNIFRSVGNGGTITDCIYLADDLQWIGGPEWRQQHWPIQHMYIEDVPYVPLEQNAASVAERYWLSSKGFYIYGSERDPLFLDQNNIFANHLCLVAKNKAPYRNRTNVTLNYEVGALNDARAAHEYVVNKHLGKPSGLPDQRMVLHPIWSTWARYKSFVNESLVRELADAINKEGFENSQIEIDDGWETCYGSATFNTKFPDVISLTDYLHKKGFRVTMWIHPFINKNCNDGQAYDYAIEHDYVVKNTDGGYETKWWQGESAVAIDFTNPDAVLWWVGRLRKLQDLGIDGFKFDAGELSYLPQPIADLNGDNELQPGLYNTVYMNKLVENFNSMIEVRSAWRTQNLPIFVRMLDKESSWTFNNGLPTLVTTLLQMNLNGYPFVLPDMIGGNGYLPENINLTALPSKEIFVRWLQANTFMPSLQYSFVPWDYDRETIDLSRKFTKMHADFAPRIISLMEQAISIGSPVNPPIWWIDPTDQEAHKVNDEYLLGEEILAAPVLHEGVLSRDIYLPKGKWRDGNDEKQYNGPIWLRDYSAPLDVLPYFHKVG